MPLEHGTSNSVREANIKTEIAAGKRPDVAVAIGYSEQRRARKKGTLSAVKKRRRKAVSATAS